MKLTVALLLVVLLCGVITMEASRHHKLHKMLKHMKHHQEDSSKADDDTDALFADDQDNDSDEDKLALKDNSFDQEEQDGVEANASGASHTADDDDDALQINRAEPEHHGDAHAQPQQQHAGGGHDWGYDTNGADWAGLCKDGRRQSPVNIQTSATLLTAEPKWNLDFHYKPTTGLSVKNNGHTIQIEGADMGYLISEGGARYDVKQFHFHAPSEHAIDGRLYDLEMHIVHQKQGATGKNDLLVVGILFQLSAAPSPFLTLLNWFKLPAKDGSVPTFGPVDLSYLSSIYGDFYAYPGSLTTPTCDETVSWRLMKLVQPISTAQLESFQKLFAKNTNFAKGNGNNRSPQPLNGRAVYLISAKPQQSATQQSACVMNTCPQTCQQTCQQPAPVVVQQPQNSCCLPQPCGC